MCEMSFRYVYIFSYSSRNTPISIRTNKLYQLCSRALWSTCRIETMFQMSQRYILLLNILFIPGSYQSKLGQRTCTKCRRGTKINYRLVPTTAWTIKVFTMSYREIRTSFSKIFIKEGLSQMWSGQVSTEERRI